MARLRIIRGNTKVLDVLCKDENDAIITTLASAQEIKFHVKDEKESASFRIAKDLANGIAIDTPSTGYLRITLLPTDTTITPQLYQMGLEIKWDDDNVYEAEKITIDDVEVSILEIMQSTVNDNE